MAQITIVSEHCRHPDGARMSYRDYVRGGGSELPVSTRVLFEEPTMLPGRMRYDAAVIAMARGHQPLPAVRDLVRGLSPDEPGESLASPRPRGRQPRHGAASVVGILYDPRDRLSPTSHASLMEMKQRFALHGIQPLVVDPRDDLTRAPIDALFIRTHTSPGQRAWRWATSARNLDIPVIDDPDSIVRCCNKLFMMERFRLARVPAPRGFIVSSEDDLEDAIARLGAPLVIKTPDSSFSQGVLKADNAAAAFRIFNDHRHGFPFLLAQEFVPTSFDWRVGVLDGEPLYACRYFMAPGHWQIFKAENDGGVLEGRGQAIGLRHAPRDIVATAVQAANCMGRGLYGVDLKVVDGKVLVIEVNDNPTIESDLEASLDPVWERLSDYFRAAIGWRSEPAAFEARASA